jgi:hypothetical protein
MGIIRMKMLQHLLTTSLGGSHDARLRSRTQENWTSSSLGPDSPVGYSMEFGSVTLKINNQHTLK